MADKKERIYTIPLRKEFLKAPKYKRSAKSIRAIKQFLMKHMKTEAASLGNYLNQEIWKNGPKNPPSKVTVKVITEEGIAKAEIVGAPEEIKEEPKKDSKKKKETIEKKYAKKKEVPKAKELEEKKEVKKKVTKKVPTASELKEKKEKKE